MDIGAYRQALQEFVSEAIHNTNGTTSEIGAYLWELTPPKGWFVRNKSEKARALTDARRAFDEHRHWPLEIILSHLGVEHPSTEKP